MRRYPALATYVVTLDLGYVEAENVKEAIEKAHELLKATALPDGADFVTTVGVNTPCGDYEYKDLV